MFKYDTPQKVYQIGRSKVGGNPGEYPTVLAGSIFYGKEKIVTDPKAGVFDKDGAMKLIKQQEEMSDTTGNPLWLQIVEAPRTPSPCWASLIASRSAPKSMPRCLQKCASSAPTTARGR